nr:MAG TPA: minor tail protein [Caudoviricetes sp.]
MAADGSIVFSAEIDDKQAQAELKKLETKIEKLNNKIYDKRQAQLPLVEQSKQLGAALDAAQEKLQDMRNGTSFFYTKSQIKDQEKVVKSLDKQFQALNNRIDKIGDSIASDTRNLDGMKAKAGELSGQIAGAKNQTSGMSDAAEEASKRMDKFSQHVKTLAKRVLVFSLISAGLRALKNYLWEAIQQNDEAVAAIARLKGALMTLAQPIVEVVIPAFTLLINVLTRIVTAVARLVSMLFGTTIQKSAAGAKALNKQKNAIEDVGEAAEEASGSLADFDELTTISYSDNKSSGNGGLGDMGVDASGGIAPDFTSMIDDGLSAILELFTGAALLALGAILTFSGANIPLGIALMVLGAIAIWDAISENWNAIKEMLQGPLGWAVAIISTALLVIGAILIFTGANVPLGIGLLIAGAIGLATTVAANWNFIVEALQGPLGLVMGLLSTAFLVLGIIILFTGASLPLGLGLLIIGAVGMAASIAPNWNTIIEALQGPLGAVVALVSGALLVLGIILLFTGVGIPLGVGLVLAGAAGLVGTVAVNWNFIQDKIMSIWDGIKNWWNTKVKKYFTAQYWQDLGRKMLNGLSDGLKNAWTAVKNWVLDKVQWIIDAFNSVSNFFSNTFSKKNNLGSGGVGGYGAYRPQAMPALRRVEVPALAQGAVIPANKKFLAVLGDQTSGTNVEAPLSTIQQAAVQAFAEMGPEFARYIVQAFVEAGMLGNIRAIEDYARVTAQKDFTLGKPSSSAGRWINQSMEAYEAVRG